MGDLNETQHEDEQHIADTATTAGAHAAEAVPPENQKPTIDLIDANRWGIFRFILKWIGIYAAFVVVALFAAVAASLLGTQSAFSALSRLFAVDAFIFPLILVLVIACGLVKRFVVKRQRAICANNVPTSDGVQGNDFASSFEELRKSNSFGDRIFVGYLKTHSALQAKKIKFTLAVIAVVLAVQAFLFCLFMAAPSVLCPHEWEAATCTQPKTCLLCSETTGFALGHTFGQWETTKKATCSEEGQKAATCTRCGERFTQAISKTSHTGGEWTVEKDYSISSTGTVTPGLETQKCTVCGEQINSRTYTVTLTTSQTNAMKKASSYLRSMAFSYSGLVEQLEYEGFSGEDATFAVDHCGADWNVQADRMAAQYLKTMAFSRSGLIEQLEFEGFTEEQATHGVDSVGL